MEGKNIILAGVARSGSTLVCHLLNNSSDVVALHEPIQPKIVPMKTDEAVAYIQNYFDQQRHLILSSGIAESCSSSGKVPDNHVGKFNSKTGKREVLLDGKKIIIDKSLDNSFSLLIKQPGMFTALLSVLKEYFPCYATIRNPLAVLRSWNSVDMAVTNGHAPAAEERDQLLKQALKIEPDRYQRQLILLSWYFEQYTKYLTESQIIRYEDVISTGGQCLSRIDSSLTISEKKLENKNNNALYDRSIKNVLAECLLDSNGFYWNYYSKQDVLDLLE